MSKSIAPQLALLALCLLGGETVEGEFVSDTLNAQLNKLGLDDINTELLVSDRNLFLFGYTRALTGSPILPSFAPGAADAKNKWRADGPSIGVIESGFTVGIALRGSERPPSGLVAYEAFVAGELSENGAPSAAKTLEWASKVDGKLFSRLSVPVTVGSGKETRVVPAGTPVDVIKTAVVDGVNTVFAWFDGVVLRIPSPPDAPGVVDGTVTVAAPAKVRNTAKRAAGAPKEPKVAKERTATLRDAFIHVCESPGGPLLTNTEFAQRVVAYGRDVLKLPNDKTITFLSKADVHVPYYLIGYKPTKEGHPGRQGVANPLSGAINAITIRAAFLKTTGDDINARLKACGCSDAVIAEILNPTERIATTAAPKVEKVAAAPAAAPEVPDTTAAE